MLDSEFGAGVGCGVCVKKRTGLVDFSAPSPTPKLQLPLTTSLQIPFRPEFKAGVHSYALALKGI